MHKSTHRKFVLDNHIKMFINPPVDCKFSRQDSWRFQICLFEEIFVGMILVKIASNFKAWRKTVKKLHKNKFKWAPISHLTNWSLRTTPLTAVVWPGITISASLEQVKTQLCFIVIQCLVRFLKWLTVACSGLGNLTNIEGLALTCPRSSPPPSCRAWTHLPANPCHKK